MRKVIAAINMSLDGIFDHTAMSPDGEVHSHYAALLNDADAILYGRTTYELMKYWQSLLANPSGEQSMDGFALSIDRLQKIVFSNTLKETGWASAELSEQSPEEVVAALKRQPGKDILVGSRSIIMQLMNLNAIDEYQICVHPVVVGEGRPLFYKVSERRELKYLKTKSFKSGALILYYGRA